MMRMWNWLKPGLGLKRWISMTLVGGVVLALGLSGFFDEYLPELTGLGLRAYVLTLLGLLLIGLALLGLIFSLVSKIYTDSVPLVQKLQRRSRLQSGPSIVAIGGGTGLSTFLRGLKEYTVNLTAVVAVTDDGGSSGRLRDDFDLPAPGDLRNCLVALAPEEQRLSELFTYRFSGESELAGHSLGNILLTALSDIHGGFPEAIRACSEVLAIQGRVLPAMLGHPELRATMSDDSQYVGETNITSAGKQIESLEVVPQPARPNPEAISAVADADLIVVGPGSLYTSILTNFLEPKLCSAVCQADAPVVYICNLMTQAGETGDYRVSDHLEAFKEIPPQPVVFDHILVNTRQAPREIREEYEAEGARQVQFDYDVVKKYDLKIHAQNFIEVDEHIRHDVGAVVERLEGIVNFQGGAG